jgi:hypothetical protein
LTGVTDSSSSLDARLRFAIANRRLIQLRYNGRVRVAEPHDYGVHRGDDRLFVYQLDDQGRADARGWRLLYVQKIESCVVLDETFRGTRNQGQRHLKWEVVYARVE